METSATVTVPVGLRAVTRVVAMGDGCGAGKCSRLSVQVLGSILLIAFSRGKLL